MFPKSAVTLVLLVTSLSIVHAEDCPRVAVWRDGKAGETLCRDDATARGLAVIDLRDTWVPPALAPGPTDDGPAYRATYLALAQERFADTDESRAPSDRYFELFGIQPTFTVLRARLEDAARHACHAAIDDRPLADVPARLPEEPAADAFARIATARALRAELEHDRAREHLPDLDALATSDPYFRRAVDRLAALEHRVDLVRTIQAHLACDGLVHWRVVDGGYTWQTTSAVEAFQRGVMILPTGTFTTDTRDALVLASDERDFRAALRTLRERVVAATGLIEDGTAGPGEATVLDRALVPEATWRVRGHDPLDDAAPDLVAAATEAAARALGWRDAASTRAFLAARPDLVAIALPPAPAYHRAAMDLAIAIDRGDVWHDPVPRYRDPPRRPAVVIYALDGDRRIPLARWPTTIGGWQDQRFDDGDVEKQWKESPVGPRIWRDLMIGPRWLPPKTTPDKELVRVNDADRYVLSREALGPSYRSAFGMVAFVHLRADLEDEGIRTHGTGNLASLANGVSHGCHRVLGRNIVRLAGFVLAHHDVVRRGDVPTYYRRVVRYGGTFPVAIDSLGYRIELVPPIPVEVMPGRVHAP